MDRSEVEANLQDGTSIMPMFPLSSVLFPGAALPLRIFEDRYRHLVADVMTGDRAFGVVLIARGSEVGGGDARLSPLTHLIVNDFSRSHRQSIDLNCFRPCVMNLRAT